MRALNFLWPALLALAATEADAASRSTKNRILLSDVKSLTFRQGAKTTARRVSPIPQLKCIGGNARGLYDVEIMRCKNAGSDYDDENIQWTCTADLPEEFKLGSTDVICEGFDSPDDPYVLKGSCGVEYRLSLTTNGLEKYGRRRDYQSGSDGETVSDGVAIIFWILFFGVVIWMLFKACIVGGGDVGSPNTWTGPRGGGGGGGGGGGWGGPGNDDPPPPYTPRPSYYRKQYPSDNSRGWRPGFWLGAAGGATAGYAAGRYASRRDDSAFGGRGGSSFWNSAGEGPSGIYRSPSSSSSTRESTGFGETRRR